MTKQNLIVYPPGCYGTFFEWLANYLQNPLMTEPFRQDGSSHEFKGNHFTPKEMLFEHIQSNKKLQFSRIHPGLFDNINQNEKNFEKPYDQVLQEEFDFLKKHFDNILVVTFDNQSVLWYYNNFFKKIFESEDVYEHRYKKYGYSKDFKKTEMTKNFTDKVKHMIDITVQSKASTLTTENLSAWGHASIYDFQTWELREFLSMYWFSQSDEQLDAWRKVKLNNQEILVFTITQLKENFNNTVKLMQQKFGIDTSMHTSIDDNLYKIFNNWKTLQQDIDKDIFCKNMVESIITNKLMVWDKNELTIIDEAWIQKSLRNHGYNFKCFDLNEFPSNSQNFQTLIEKII